MSDNQIDNNQVVRKVLISLSVYLKKKKYGWEEIFIGGKFENISEYLITLAILSLIQCTY